MNELLQDSVGPISRGDTLTDKADAVLRHALASGAFTPGQIITIRALSSRLGVSVTPAKDAMARLIAERVLEWGPRRSALVPKLTLESVDEIYKIRTALETTAAVAALPNIDTKHLIAMGRIHKELASAFGRGDYKSVLSQNQAFHFYLYKQAQLPLLLRMIEGLWLRLGPSLNLLYSSYSKADWAHREGTGYHEEILAALRVGDPAETTRHLEADLKTGHIRLHDALAAAAASLRVDSGG